MTTPLLQVTNLRKEYHSGGKQKVAVGGVSFQLQAPGSSLAIVGESGSGKSTIAKILTGLEQSDGGEVLVEGKARERRPRDRVARLRQARDVQMVFQDPFLSLDPRITVEAALASVLRLHGIGTASGRSDRIDELLESVGLRLERRRMLPHHLSGGERQRVAIARAIAVSPRLLVLDESVSALDVSTQWRVLQLLNRLRDERGLAYIFITHDLGVARYISAQTLVMRKGVAVEVGPTSDVFRNPQHEYTRLLIDSIPTDGWQPERVLRAPRIETDAIETTGNAVHT